MLTFNIFLTSRLTFNYPLLMLIENANTRIMHVDYSWERSVLIIKKTYKFSLTFVNLGSHVAELCKC